MELVQTSEQNEFSLLNLNSTTEKINKTLSKIKEDFIYIGFLLWEVREYKFYLSKGYESVVDYAEKELNFKKTSTYNFISVCEKFSSKKDNGNPTINLDMKYKDFNFSQLVEIKTLPVEQLESFNSSMSNRDIKDKKKELNIVAKKKNVQVENIIDVEFKQDQVDLVKNQVVIFDDFVPVVKDKVKIMEYLNDRKIVLRDLAKSQKKDSIDKVKYSAGEYEIELLIDFISKEDYDFFQS